MNMEMMKSLLGKTLRVDRGGHESRVGKLLAIGEDHLTLLTKEDGIIYYKAHHIKSVTENSKNQMPLDLEIPENFELTQTANFKEALNSLKYQWVKINRGGKESLEGVLDDINDDFVTVVKNEEVIRIATFHIRNISYGEMIGKPTKEEAKSKEEEKETQEEKE
ncbi:hypothetical protein [Bacillus sp. V5-8f]|uniref:hypothetical protein n=1 Tax=Bacillus sp. V5-8f TaxID=2053044 RepID=UPI000C78B6E4|nr:hypothetical protein [Bacillus sp. V5-8f]PLT35301.1 hypothetical protein CUU64_03545 [Bacillus sp. V5-8f]